MSNWFCGCDVYSMTIPATVEIIGAEAFYECANLKQVTFLANSKLDQIRERSFRNTSLEEIVIPSSVTIIREGAFRGCKKLMIVTF